ncbi:hypothetical protein DTU70_15925 [Salmonella enterica subsp. enterica serovar Weltevreden]|nr:hypothetical protein [Salmonella enterica]EBM0149854.1 hypothetical protein [Salmonella enterica]EBX8804606.1 hypothetical protein [Salmonella enterica subsp. enterica serovar Weltevreden]EBX9288010.1 hypothetical protein [Salmonella enterica subsp. enterica serovar Brunei]
MVYPVCFTSASFILNFIQKFIDIAHFIKKTEKMNNNQHLIDKGYSLMGLFVQSYCQLNYMM